LLEHLEQYVVSWNGDPVSTEDWEFISSHAAPGDLKEVVKTVVTMHEGTGSRAPKLPSPSSTKKTSATG
jgi:hypothetical protein